jgi:CHAT domain-containing protein
MFDPLTEESSFATDMRQVFKAAIDTELQSTSGDDIARIDTAQHILETYREAELQSVFGDGCVPSRPGVTIATLSPNEIVLYPIILPDRIELLYARGGMAGFRRLPAQPMRERAVRALVANVVSMSVYEGDEWKPSAAKLYELLVQPIENLFGDGATLVIVPDAALRPLPFAALIDARGRYLVERTRISVAPALAYSDPGEAGDGGQNARVVAAAIEHNVTLPMGLFQALAATGAEARIAAGIADSSRTRGRVIENFGKGDLVRTIEAGGFDVLHLATHASFNGRSDQSFIVTSDAPMMLSELRTVISTGRTRGDRIDLLVLSACETAVGDDSASMGLAGVAVEAGANSVIASLWQVNDIGTGQLMRAFYGAYRGGAGRADALRTAQLEMIRSGGQNSDPYIWSAFTLLGSWR